MSILEPFLKEEMVLSNQYFSLHLLLVIFTLNPLMSSSSCCGSCGRTKVPYPFGFSKGCKIRLQCKEEGAYIGEFKVTVTGKDIVVHVPVKCNRPIHVFEPLFTSHYAPTRQTFLILRDCSSPVTGCSIPKALMNSSWNYLCGGSLSCYSVQSEDNYIQVGDLQRNNCSYLTTSVASTFDSASKRLSLQLETINLSWGLAGGCSCSPNATCIKVHSPVNHTDWYRCQCAEGFEGDGFTEGKGCKRVSITVGLATNCNRICDHHGGKRKTEVQYPFGFSGDCGITLNCTEEGKVQIGEFEVEVTANNIIVHIPVKCNRSINVLKPLFGLNFAPTLRNGLLVQNCTTPPTRCVIPADLMQSQFKMGCDQPYCYSKMNNGSDYIGFSDVETSSCTNLLSSVSVALVDSTNKNMSLEFETIKLGWWLEGECNCSSNAGRREIISPVSGRRSCRCWCAEGFHGDGFAAGVGCRKISNGCGVQEYLRGHCGGAKLRVLIGCFLAGACLVIGLASLCYVIRQRNKASRSRESTRKLLSEAAVTFTVPFYSYKEIERATFCFAEKYRLGNGAYGTVYAGKLHNEEWVAIKKIRHRDREGMDSIMNEIKLISSVNHPNLVHLLGFCLEKDEQILVYEFMPNGTLSQHLQRERGTGLPWTIRLNIATETAHAIAHLHSMDPPIFHRDIKSSNILLDTNLNSKVADFGLSRIGMPESSHISTAPQGTPGYLDPQYHQNFHLSDKSDVYSFGVVLVEIITAMKVVDFSRSQTEVNLAALAIEKIGKGCLDDIIDPFLEPARDAWTLSSIHKMAELAFRCLAFHKDVRPSMIEVAAELEQIKLSGWAPLEASCYSSPSKGSNSMKSQSSIAKKETLEKLALGSRRVVSTQVKDWSPISVNEPWLSEQSSPSTNSFGKPGTQ